MNIGKTNSTNHTHNILGRLDRFAKKTRQIMTRSELDYFLAREVRTLFPIKDVFILHVNEEREKVSAGFGNHPKQEISSIFSRMTTDPNVGQHFPVQQGCCIFLGRQKAGFRVLWLNEEINEENQDVLLYLNILVRYSGVIYENFNLVEEIIADLRSEVNMPQHPSPWFARLLVNASESERCRLAADLHDTILQELMIQCSSLKSALQDNEMPERLRMQLGKIRDGLQDAVCQIRETCNQFRPPFFLESGLVCALGRLFDQARQQSNYTIDFEVKTTSREANSEQSLIIYRIVQELLNNAEKHAKATTVQIILEQNETITLYYRDDGIGMDMTKMHDCSRHMGLSGIRERVRSLGGSIEFNSRIREGFQAIIKFPNDGAEIDMKGGI